MSAKLNKIQIKAEIMFVLTKLQTMPQLCEVDELFKELEAQEDKSVIQDLLLKELIKADDDKAVMVCYMLLRLCEKEKLEEDLWNILKSKNVSDYSKSIVMNLLKDMGNSISYDSFEEYFENPDEIIDEDTKKLLNVAIMNPEAQIDFLDFLNSLNFGDRKILVQSLGEDYTEDALANIISPVFLSEPDSELGKLALDILGETKSQLALHALMKVKDFAEGDLLAAVKKNISKLKIAGVREDNTSDFYRDLLAETSPYESYTNYPDGHGNQALIFSRIRENETLQFMAAVVSEEGIVDCFGFNEISQDEFKHIVDRFYGKDERVYINPTVLKTMLEKAELQTYKNEGKISYEFVCWKMLTEDISTEPVPMQLLLDPYIEKKKLSDSELERIYMLETSQHWFIDEACSVEFKNLVDNLNDTFAKDDFTVDLDEIVRENCAIIFNQVQKRIWQKRFLMSAYLKYLSGQKGEATLYYSLANDENALSKMFENILKKSLYEYYFTLKFKLKEKELATNIFMLKNGAKTDTLSEKQIDMVIKLIESKWVVNE